MQIQAIHSLAYYEFFFFLSSNQQHIWCLVLTEQKHQNMACLVYCEDWLRTATCGSTSRHNDALKMDSERNRKWKEAVTALHF